MQISEVRPLVRQELDPHRRAAPSRTCFDRRKNDANYANSAGPAADADCAGRTAEATTAPVVEFRSA